MGKISFGGINKSLLFIILMSVCMVLNQYLYGFIYIECFYKMNIYQILYNAIIDKEKSDFPRHRLFDPFFSYLGIILCALFIPKEKNRKRENEIDENENSKGSNLAIKLIHNKAKKFIKTQKGIIIFVGILILWIIEENLILIFVDIFQDLDFWFFELIFISLIFSEYFIFKIYSHQILGMAISIGIGSILKIYNITIAFTSEDADKTLYSKYPFLCVFIILYLSIIMARSYVNTQLKVFMDLKFISHRTLLIFYGLTGAIICLIVGVIISFIPCPYFMKNYVCNVNYDDKIYYENIQSYIESWQNMLVRAIIIVLGILTFFFHKYYYTLIIKAYTPIHVIFSFPWQFFIEKTFLLIFTSIFFRDDLFSQDKQLEKFLLDISGDISSIIGFFIYLEMIELNFCQLNYNLKKNIIERGENEYNISLEIHEKIEEEPLASDSESDTED